jgi:anaerobic magnesium-protoporphyrin IX monomethyl ester cyclase
MKILLVKPVTKRGEIYNVIPPIGLGYLATALRRIGAQVDILDCVKEGFGFLEFLDYVKKFHPQMVGFQVYSCNLELVKKAVSLIKNLDFSIYIVIGGPHPSGLPLESLNQLSGADFGFKGEAEIGLPLLVKEILKDKNLNPERLSKIPGLIWRSNGRIISNLQVFPDSLDELGFPSWDLINPRDYPLAPQGAIFKKFPFAPIVTTRGCPHNCGFCAGYSITGKKVRKRSIENIIEEIVFLRQRYGIKEIHFLDDNFTLDKEYVQGFCQRIINEGLRFNWCCPNGLRLDSLDGQTISMMKQAGCYYISVGIESGSPRILREQRKGLAIQDIKSQISLIRKYGIDVNGFFIIGYPGETEEDIEATIDFSKRLGLSRAAFFNFIPLPGSTIYEALSRKGEIKNLSWENLTQNRVSYAPAGISKKKLKRLQQKAYLIFYLRPRVIYKLAKQIKTFEQFRYILMRILDIFR